MTDEERVDFLDQLDEDVDIVETGADDSIESSVDSDEADRLLGTEHSSSIRDEIDEDTRLTSNERAAARKSNSLTEADVGTEDGPAQIDPDDPIPVIEPHVHEVNAHLLFTNENYDAFGQDDVSDLNDREVIRRHDENALSPYWAVVSQWEENLQERYGTFEAAGHGWEFVPSGETDGAKYWNGKIAARGQSYDAFNEYQIGVRTTDELGARKVTLQLRPALPVATHCDTGDGLGNTPRDMPYGIRIQFGTSNVGPDQMLEVLRKLASHIDINPDYFSEERIHSWSRGYGAGLYVRLKRDIGERKLVGRGALLERLARFGSTTEGSTGEYHWDNEEVIGHRAPVTLDNTAWSKLLPENQFAKFLKYYHPRNPRSADTSSADDPLADPKLEVQFSNEHNLEGSVPWTSDGRLDFEDLLQGMENALVNSLDWANISTRADERVWTSDRYWELTESVREYIDIIPDPIPRTAASENAAALRQFAQGGPSATQRSVVRIVADGGSAQHWSDIAERANVGKSTVYRTVRNFDDILRVKNGVVGFEDGIVRDRIDELLGAFNDSTGSVVLLADSPTKRSDSRKRSPR